MAACSRCSLSTKAGLLRAIAASRRSSASPSASPTSLPSSARRATYRSIQARHACASRSSLPASESLAISSSRLRRERLKSTVSSSSPYMPSLAGSLARMAASWRMACTGRLGALILAARAREVPTCASRLSARFTSAAAAPSAAAPFSPPAVPSVVALLCTARGRPPSARKESDMSAELTSSVSSSPATSWASAASEATSVSPSLRLLVLLVG
mmetsp:Transcript_21566/g.50271  ORF Transcript_21566/g.50271 Transcript_21566/m.50271 type:complete len:214 (-) Transcript_21566:831-1472(-)